MIQNNHNRIKCQLDHQKHAFCFKIYILALLVPFIYLRAPEARAKSTQNLIRALLIVGQSPFGTGPNCWNYALYSNGLQLSLRSTEPAEFLFFLQSPLCRLVHSTPQMGDIGSFSEISKDGSQITHHGFTYLTQNMVLSKNGANTQSHYQALSLEKLKQIKSYTPPGYLIQNFRCISVERWIMDNFKNAHLELAIEIFKHFKEFESQYQTAQEQKYTIPLKTVRDFHGYLREYRRDWVKLLREQNKSSLQNELLFTKVIIEWLNGLSGQFYYTHGDPVMSWFTQEGADWSRLLLNSK